MDKHRQRLLDIQEKKDKKKARRFAFFFFIVSIILLLFPFMIKKAPEDQIAHKVVHIAFDKKEFFDKVKASQKASKKSSTKPQKSAEPKREEKPNPPPPTAPEPKPEVKPPPRKPITVPKELPKRKVTLSTPEREVSFAPLLTEISEKAEVEEVSDEVVEVTEEVSADVMSDISSYFDNVGPASGDDATGVKSNDSEAGEGSQGSSDTGDSNSDGQGEFGSDGDGFDGDGLLTRKVIYRANIKDVVQQSGKIAVNLCVNQKGDVVWAKPDPRSSTLKAKHILDAAIATIKKYKYEEDFSVAEKQCGRFVFVIKMDEE